MKNLIDILENHKLWLGGFEKGGHANLSYANLRYANLRDADLCDASYNEFTSFFAIQCPEEGSFIAYKKAINKALDVIVKLEITSDAKRSSATSRKCRASKFLLWLFV